MYSFSTLFVLIGFIHGLVIIYFLTGLLKKNNTAINNEKPTVSVIIAARNESNNIGKCVSAILSQSYPPELFEVIVINDRSTDDTADIVKKISEADSNVKLYNVDEVPSGIHPKKYALTIGVEKSSGDLIFETDADVTVGSDWINSTVERFTSDVGLVVGVSNINGDPSSAIENFQIVDFLLLVASSQGSLRHGIPMGGTGQNLAYRKSIFEEVGGLAINSQRYVSNDILFITKVSKTKWNIVGNLNPKSAVSTLPLIGWKQFISQRTRWASNAYWKGLKPLLVFILGINYIMNLFVAVGLVIMVINLTFYFPVIILVIYKFFTELLFYKIVSHRMDKTSFIRSFVGWFIRVTPYILLIAVLGGLGMFKWKGQKVTPN